MPPLRDVLVKQAGVLGNIEEGFPEAAPRVSRVMANVASSFPLNLNLPELPIGLRNNPKERTNVIKVIRGLEEVGHSESGSGRELTGRVVRVGPSSVGNDSKDNNKEEHPSQVEVKRPLEADGF